jgi:endonuclease
VEKQVDMIDLKKIVDDEFLKLKSGETFNTEAIVKEFEANLSQKSDEELIEALIICGYIPDLYEPDSSKETLFTKLCEVIEVIWARRMGYQAKAITQKSGYEDVEIIIDNKVIVSDTKSFRLSRSQAAPNVKDFVKPGDYNNWLKRKPIQARLGGLVVYPQLHEWAKLSNAHIYCSDASNPIVMLPFHYLAYLLKAKNNLHYDPNKLIALWDFQSIFKKEFTNRIEYWKIINQQIISITGDNLANLKCFLQEAEEKMHEFVLSQQQIIIEQINSKRELITKELSEISDSSIREEFLKYKNSKETENLSVLLERISKFRIKGQHTNYSEFISKEFE